MVENGSDPVYRFYADEAIKLGLTAGYCFGHQDSGHVQGPSAGGAVDVYTWSYIDSVMKARFADKERVALAGAVARTVVRIDTAAFSAQLGMRGLAAATAGAGRYYKDDPILIAPGSNPISSTACRLAIAR
jgi:hypothetical protein